MKTNEVKKSKNGSVNIQLIKGDFIPSEASQIIMNLINEKINFHKMQRLQIWEANHTSKTDVIDDRIKELESEKAKAKIFFDKAIGLKLRLNIKGSIEINVLNSASA